jgi:enoyl-CoA hydratase
MEYKKLLLEIEEGIAILTFNRPKALNALSAELLIEFRDALHKLEENDEVKAIILTGAGDKSFVAGADIVAMKEMNSQDALDYSSLGHECLSYMESMSKPLIAAVNGFALGGGAEVTLACDFIFASENAQFGQPEINLGIIPGYGGTQRLPRTVGKGLARQLIYTGDIISAKMAREIGWVNKIFPPEELIPETKKIAKKIASKSKLAIKAAKNAINAGYDIDLSSGCEIEKKAFSLLFDGEDAKEGLTAFLEKRPPKFTGK